ncbi:hypothetical protein HHK36_010951 [Tetracentron sinense]|uniref:Histone H2B n=1 Tax=Tetracentron sinense TaxID=13715 RepID=A0A834Z9F7_TETSI|nr:hypothetical protein HHK36_010951 [Tetracentron sinense]
MAPRAEKKPAEKKPVAEKPTEEKKTTVAEKAPAEKKPKAGKRLPKEGVAAGEKKKKRGKKNVETYKIYIFKVLKQVHPDIGISSKAMGIMNSFINDIFEKLAQESSKLSRYNKKHTISSREIQTAVRLVLPGELAKHAVSEGTKAVTKFFDLLDEIWFGLSKEIEPITRRKNNTISNPFSFTCLVPRTESEVMDSVDSHDEETPLVVADLPIETPKNHARDVHILSSAFLLIFLAYGAAQNLESTVNTEDNLGTTSLGILYLSFTFFSLVASPMVRMLGSKNSLILGTTGYWLFIASNLKPTWYTMVPASLYLGFAASIIWVGQGTYLTSTARSHAKDCNLHEGTVIGNFNGEFWGMFASHQLIGNLISLALLRNGTGTSSCHFVVVHSRWAEVFGVSFSALAHTSLTYRVVMVSHGRGSGVSDLCDTSISGDDRVELRAVKCQSGNDRLGVRGAIKIGDDTPRRASYEAIFSLSRALGKTVLSGLASSPKRSFYDELLLHSPWRRKGGSISGTTVLFIVFLGSMTLGTILMCFLHKRDVNEEKEQNSSASFYSSVVSLSKLVIAPLFDKRMLLTIPLIAYSGLQQAFVWAEFTKYIVKPALGVSGVGGSMAVYGAFDALVNWMCSVAAGRFTSGLSSITLIVSGGALIQAIVLLWILLKYSLTSGVLGYVYPLLMAALLGIGDGVFNTQLNALLGMLFKHDTEGAFAQLKVWQSASIAVVFFLSPYISMHAMLVVMLAALFIALAGFLFLTLQMSEDTVKTLKWPHCKEKL